MVSRWMGAPLPRTSRAQLLRHDTTSTNTIWCTQTTAVMFNCHQPGHLARNCRQPPRNPYSYYAKESPNRIEYANATECFESHLAQGYNLYYYWGSGPWYLDSGANSHIAADFQKLDQLSYSSSVEICKIKTRRGESHLVRGSGSTIVQTQSGEIKLKPVKYVPSMKKNLVSVGAIADAGYKIIFSSQQCWIIDTLGHIIASNKRDISNGLYYFATPTLALTTETTHEETLQHRRMGHLSYASLNHLSRTSNVIGLLYISPLTKICSYCLTGRQHMDKFLQKSDSRTNKPREKIHTNLMGPMHEPSLGSSRYVLVFTDNFSCKSWIYFLKDKSETLSRFIGFKSKIEGETSNRLHILCSDRGGKYLSNKFTNLCTSQGIHRKLT